MLAIDVGDRRAGILANLVSRLVFNRPEHELASRTLGFLVSQFRRLAANFDIGTWPISFERSSQR